VGGRGEPERGTRGKGINLAGAGSTVTKPGKEGADPCCCQYQTRPRNDLSKPTKEGSWQRVSKSMCPLIRVLVAGAHPHRFHSPRNREGGRGRLKRGRSAMDPRGLSSTYGNGGALKAQSTLPMENDRTSVCSRAVGDGYWNLTGGRWHKPGVKSMSHKRLTLALSRAPKPFHSIRTHNRARNRGPPVHLTLAY